MADLNEQNWDDDQQYRDEVAEDLPTAQPDLVVMPDSAADDLDNDPGSSNQDVNVTGSKGGDKTGIADNASNYADNLASDEVGSEDILEDMDAQQLGDNSGYEEWGYYSTEDEPLDY